MIQDLMKPRRCCTSQLCYRTRLGRTVTPHACNNVVKWPNSKSLSQKLTVVLTKAQEPHDELHNTCYGLYRTYDHLCSYRRDKSNCLSLAQFGVGRPVHRRFTKLPAKAGLLVVCSTLFRTWQSHLPYTSPLPFAY